MFKFEEEVYQRMFKEYGEDPITEIKKLSHKDYMTFVNSLFADAKTGVDVNIVIDLLGNMNSWRCEDELHMDFSSDDRKKLNIIKNLI